MPFYTPEPVEKEIINLHENLCIPVIASYNPLGECRPLYFQLQNDDGSNNTISIDKVLSSKKNSIFGMIYHCAVTIAGCRQYVTMHYHCQSGQWSVKKSTDAFQNHTFPQS